MTMRDLHTMRSEPFTALIVAGFSFASYRDGAFWISGFCGGCAVAMLGEYLFGVAVRRRSDGENVGPRK